MDGSTRDKPRSGVGVQMLFDTLRLSGLTRAQKVFCFGQRLTPEPGTILRHSKRIAPKLREPVRLFYNYPNTQTCSGVGTFACHTLAVFSENTPRRGSALAGLPDFTRELKGSPSTLCSKLATDTAVQRLCIAFDVQSRSKQEWRSPR